MISKVKKINISPKFLDPSNNWQMLIARISSFATSLKNRMAGHYMKLEMDTILEFHNVQAYLLQENVGSRRMSWLRTIQSKQ